MPLLQLTEAVVTYFYVIIVWSTWLLIPCPFVKTDNMVECMNQFK